MGKILITGMNKAQTTRDFFERQVLKVVPSHYALIRTLEDLGYEVEHRHVDLGEDLSSYDDVIIYLHTPKSYCQRLYAGLYAIAARPDAILAFDDWQVNQIHKGIAEFRDILLYQPAGAFKQWFFDLQAEKYDQQLVKNYAPSYVEGCEIAAARKNRLLISAFAGGDIRKLDLGWQEDRVFTFNPNPYHLNRHPDNNWGVKVLTQLEGEDVVEKRREWNFASLLHNKTKPWLKRQGVTWPVNYYGQRKGEHKTERITEDRMCQEYQKQWGCLMPGYFHSGSGWWRARPLQVADAGSILICDKEEGAVYSECHGMWKASDVEQMDDIQRSNVAWNQKQALYARHPLDKSVTRNEISRIIDAPK